MKENILIIGGGGREHAITWCLRKSRRVGKLYAIPGNAGIAEIAECHSIGTAAKDFPAILAFIKEHEDIALTVVAPDNPLSEGLVDEIEAIGRRAWGPKKDAAIIEASKAFSKVFMKKYGIPTAEYEVFDEYGAAAAYIEKAAHPLVVKADGLAFGKGVLICNNLSESKNALKEIMLDKAFGKSGNKIVIEEFLEGPEVTVLAFTDGITVCPMVSSQDHKRAYDNDEGLNTGGMGTFSPSKAYTPEIEKYCIENIFKKTVEGLNSEGITFKGVIYFGLMITSSGVKVIEYNARFGDPETQAVLPRLKTDLLDIFYACIDDKLKDMNIEWDDQAAVCVILASGGYPKDYTKGKEITIGDIKDVTLFHSGTAVKDGRLVTNGGRVLGVTAKGRDVDEARRIAYENVEKISFDDMFYRKDIGIKK